VQNILTRVTGGNASNILGTLGVTGANFAKPLSEFTITEHGSLPPSPLEPLPGAIITNNLAGVGLPTSIKLPQQSTKPAPTPIIKAQAWIKGTDGNISLVATAPYTVTPTTNTCPGTKIPRG
jgi:large exoprotein involved in heme utilization and adhesion